MPSEKHSEYCLTKYLCTVPSQADTHFTCHNRHMTTICWVSDNEWMNELKESASLPRFTQLVKKKAQVFRTQCRQLFFPSYHRASRNADQSQPCVVPRTACQGIQDFLSSPVKISFFLCEAHALQLILSAVVFHLVLLSHLECIFPSSIFYPFIYSFNKNFFSIYNKVGSKT